MEHGLSDHGKDQAREAGKKFASEFLRSQQSYCGVAIFSSDFTRARETAQFMAEEVGNADIPLRTGSVVIEKRLRERFFGELNGGPDTRYQDVWDIDIDDPNHNEFGVESANSVLERTSKLVLELDEMLSNELDEKASSDPWKCVIVAHGDVLQILQTGFLKHEDASRHRSLPHLETATIRELNLAE